MPDFSSLIQAGTALAGGAQRGIANQRELERQARMQLLAQRLQEAQLANIQSEIQRRAAQTDIERNRPRPGQVGKYVPHVNDDGTVDYIWQPAPGEPPTGTPPTEGAPTPSPQQPVVVHSPGRVQARPHPTKAQPIVERETAAAAQSMLRAAQTANALEEQDPTAGIMPPAAAAAEGIAKVPVVGGMLGGLVGTAAQRQMTPNQQRFRQAQDEFTHNYVATLPKSRVSPQLIDQIRNVFFARPGQTDPNVLRQFREKRIAAARRLAAAAAGQSVDLSDLPGYGEGGTVVIDDTGVHGATGTTRNATPVRRAPARFLH